MARAGTPDEERWESRANGTSRIPVLLTERRMIEGNQDPGVLFVLGAPRSGTTWLAKIFDSHPDVLYVNEPDIVLREERLPVLCRVEDVERYRDVARVYLDRLIDVRTLKAAGSLPVFQKNYRSALACRLRSGIIYGLHLAEFASGGGLWVDRIRIPELVDRSSGQTPMTVIKSVSARGRARIFAEALPGSRIVFVMRHPCGAIASLLRGIGLRKMPKPSRADEVLTTDQAGRLGLTAERFEPLSLVQKLAWHWAILNQKVLDDLAGMSGVMIVRYEDVVADAAPMAQELLAFAGLPWCQQTADFVARSTTYQGPDRYFSVWKNSRATAVGWRNQLSAGEQLEILDIVHRVPAGRLFPEPEGSSRPVGRQCPESAEIRVPQPAGFG